MAFVACLAGFCFLWVEGPYNVDPDRGMFCTGAIAGGGYGSLDCLSRLPYKQAVLSILLCVDTCVGKEFLWLLIC